MRSSSLGVLFRKDLRELFGSTAFLVLLVVVGPLVALSFIPAVHAYAEASGSGGAVAALASALSPLDGIVVPTLDAYDLLVTFLVPFVAIRLVANEKSSGALKLLLQSPAGLGAQLASKMLALAIAWLVCLVPSLLALALWRSYGGHLYLPETANLLLGHTLHYLITCALALAAAGIATNAATAAIVVLAVTIGTWALDFFAAGRGGWITQVARYTPFAALRQFERGLLGADVVVASILVVLLLLTVAGAFIDLRIARAARTVRVAGVLVIAAAALFALRTDASADVSEDRRNSFSPADQALLRSIAQPVTVRLYLAAEDPRANDYERNVLTKLRRSLRDLRMEYPYAGKSALFENDERYGTIVYRLGGKEHVSRSTTEEIVLDDLEILAGLQPPERGEPTYPGYPLHAAPRGAAVLLYLAWPVAAAGLWWLARR